MPNRNGACTVSDRNMYPYNVLRCDRSNKRYLFLTWNTLPSDDQTLCNPNSDLWLYVQVLDNPRSDLQSCDQVLHTRGSDSPSCKRLCRTRCNDGSGHGPPMYIDCSAEVLDGQSLCICHSRHMHNAEEYSSRHDGTECSDPGDYGRFHCTCSSAHRHDDRSIRKYRSELRQHGPFACISSRWYHSILQMLQVGNCHRAMEATLVLEGFAI